MNNFWKKTGWTCMTLLPGIVSLVLQIGIGVILIATCSVLATLQLGATPDIDLVAVEELTLELYGKYSGIMVFCYHILGLIAFGLWYYFGCRRPQMTSPAKVFRGKCLPATVILALGLCFFANAFVLVGQYVAPAAIEAYMELMEAAGLGVDAFAILASILLAPIGEEYLCRGITYHYAKKVVADMKNRHAAFWIANCLQAFMFGVVHANLIQGLYAFILGLGLGWLRERYKSLYPAMLAHFVINFSSTYLVGYPISLLPENVWSYLLLMVASFVITALGAYLAKTPKAAEASDELTAAGA